VTGYGTDDCYDSLLGQVSCYWSPGVDQVWYPATVFTGGQKSGLEADYVLYRGDACLELYLPPLFRVLLNVTVLH